ncbi:PREDICTED: uncharacterized protein LOC107071189 [Polistes dominula]|uniref:Uncharacterized protein LOC107071189 n=1 Tax=Polistes dominula TaxID=743375 RepID=A0ABM1IZ12_POLDO|nr:PREDICTED: uncharacterized protein LOC107071189 [Polistes dominula]
MACPKCHLYFLWYYLLIVAILTYPTEESNIHTKSYLRNQVEKTIENVKDNISMNINRIFYNKPINDNTYNDESSTTTVLPNVESRQIIYAPIRCPPNHVIVDGKCRLHIP